MKTTRTQNLLAAALVWALLFPTTVAHAADPLPSWNDGNAKQCIVAFVEKVTKAGSTDFVPAPERIAVFIQPADPAVQRPPARIVAPADQHQSSCSTR